MSAPGTELPIRVYGTPAGIVVGALCGAEGARLTMSADTTAAVARPARQGPARHRGATPDATPAGILRMVLHAKGCLRCQNIARGAA